MTAGLETFAKVRALHDGTDHPGERAAAVRRRLANGVWDVCSWITIQHVDGTFERVEQIVDISRRLDQGSRRMAARISWTGQHFRKHRPNAPYFFASGSDGCSDNGRFGTNRRTVFPLAIHQASQDRQALGQSMQLDHRTFDGFDARCASFTRNQAFLVCLTTDSGTTTVHSSVRAVRKDLHARVDWMQHVLDSEISRNVTDDQAYLVTLRADFERMAVPFGQPTATGTQAPDCPPAPVQPGQEEGGNQAVYPSRQTTTEKRRDVLALLDAEDAGSAPLTDREIARRTGVSPTTVGTIRRAWAGRDPAP